VHGLDPGLGLVEVTAAISWTDAEVAPVPWPEAVAAGQRALAHELVGASRAMLALAREHALERIQFGRPIASFQAVRHRLAESLVAIEAADAALAGAWDERTPFAAGVAKALAGRVPAPSPATASRSWPASASPPSTRCTATSGGSTCWTGCWATSAP
jgi:hypothetical protein